MTEDLCKQDFPQYQSPYEAFRPVSTWSRTTYEAFPVGQKHINFLRIIEGTGILIPEIEEDGEPNVACRTAVYKRIYNEAHRLVAHRVLMRIRKTGEEKIVLLLGTPNEGAILEQKEALAKLMGLTLDDILEVDMID